MRVVSSSALSSKRYGAAKRSVELDGANRWVGWDVMMSLFKTSKILDDENDTQDFSKFLVATFEAYSQEFP